jgi:hypothetical protein
VATLRNLAGYGLVVVLVLLVPTAFSYLLCLEALYRRLRRRHPDYYGSLGGPSVFLNNSISKGGRMARFLSDRRYREVPTLESSGSAIFHDFC